MANRVLDLNSYYNVVNRTTKFLYSDVAAFSPLITNKAQPCLDYKAVRNAIRNILEFRLGQRPLNPNFGNPLYYFVYEPNTPETINKLKNAIYNLFAGVEPRINIHTIDATINDTMIDNHEIYINVIYSIDGLNASPDNYTFSIA